MTDRRLLNAALEEIRENPEQLDAVFEQGHCVVLAGPGSGKTKTLTIAMARALLEDVEEPRGIACITYNNECAIELETRLSGLGITPDDRVFIGTVHSFALTQVIFPYARCVMPELGPNIRVASRSECRAAVEVAHRRVIGGNENPHDRWRFAEEKRRRDVDRDHPVWREENPELAEFVEAYEAELRRQDLIDFDDMPLLALRIIREHEWVRRSLRAKFPVLFVDEYQDLGHALHELVLLLCFDVGVRLFAVGDPDQSIYGFLGANPELLESLFSRPGVRGFRLRFNYRCGTSIIQASMAALGEERDYRGPDGTEDGNVDFHGVDGDLAEQADFIFTTLLPSLQSAGTALEEISVLYRSAKQGDEVAAKGMAHGVPFVRADTNALVKRSSRLSRLTEASARWVAGGWKDADPPFGRLAGEACALVFGPGASKEERLDVQAELIRFLRSTINSGMSTHEWLTVFRRDVLTGWRQRARTITEDWDAIDQMIERTDPTKDAANDLPLGHFGGRIEGSGRLNLSTLHSAKGREFDAVIMFAMNNDVIPNYYERQNEAQLREARRQFYVGVTRARENLHLVFKHKANSYLVAELYKRIQQSAE